MKNWWNANWILVVCGAASGLILLACFLERPVALELASKIDPGKIPNVLGTLLVVSLFVERVIEVFVSIWSDKEIDSLEQQRDYARTLQARLKQQISDLLEEKQEAATSQARKDAIEAIVATKRLALDTAAQDELAREKDLVPFKAKTRRASMWVGILIGVITSAVGFRFLNEIVDGGGLTASHPTQAALFIAADVLLTGTILAGGSKAIHHVFSVYESFMQSTRQRADAVKVS